MPAPPPNGSSSTLRCRSVVARHADRAPARRAVPTRARRADERHAERRVEVLGEDREDVDARIASQVEQSFGQVDHHDAGLVRRRRTPSGSSAPPSSTSRSCAGFASTAIDAPEHARRPGRAPRRRSARAPRARRRAPRPSGSAVDDLPAQRLGARCGRRRPRSARPSASWCGATPRSRARGRRRTAATRARSARRRCVIGDDRRPRRAGRARVRRARLRAARHGPVATPRRRR